jgi:large subunit ribosomal protein L10
MATATSGAVDIAPVRAGQRKKDSVARLTDLHSRATSAVVTDYRGLTVKQLEELRRRLRAEGVDFVVVKNTLARRAAAGAGVEQFSSVLVGPVGLAVGYGELSTPARILADYYRANRVAPMVAGLAEGQVLDQPAIRSLADLPSRDVLLGQLAGTLMSPLSTLAGSLESILSTLAATLDAYRVAREAAV